jgi:hypothetical protein
MLKMAEEFDYSIPFKNRPEYKLRCSNSVNDGVIVKFGISGSGLTGIVTKGMTILMSASTDYIFEKIETPVDIKTAMKAFCEGKTIRAEYMPGNGGSEMQINSIVPKKTNGKYYSLQSETDFLSPYTILNAKWYIEEE